MINWILGGAIVLATIVIIGNYIRQLRKGKSACGHKCPGCGDSCKPH